MTSRIQITPPASNSPSALASLYGQGYADRARSMAQGGETYGFKEEMFGPVMDEFQAGVSAAGDWLYGTVTGKQPTFSELYDERLSNARVGQEKYREENPALSIGANVLGGAAVAPARAGQAIVAAPSLLARSGQAAKAGGLWGGAAGYGEGKGGAANRARSAGYGAAAGATIGAVIPGVTDVVKGAASAIGRAFNISGRGGETAARKMFMDALGKDGVTLADLAKITEERPITLADLGQNARQLLGKAYRQSDEARGIINKFLVGRSEGQLGRMTGELSRDMGENPAVFHETDEALIAARRGNAKGAYDAAYKGSVKLTDDLRGLLGRVEKMGGYSAGKRLGEADGIVFPDDLGNASEIGVDALDYLTRGLTDMGMPGSNERRIATSLAKQIEQAAPDLAAARAKYASDSGLIDALNNGRAFLRGDTEAMTRAFSEMTPEEQRLFRLGAARELFGKMAKVRDTNDRARLFENEDIRNRLRTLFPDRESFERFMVAVKDESAMNLTKNKVMAGSDTAERVAADSGGLAGDLAALGADVAGGGGLMSTLRAAARMGTNAMRRGVGGIDEKLAPEIARLGTRTDVGAVAPRLANVPAPAPPQAAPALALPGVGPVQGAPVQGAAGAVVGRGVAPDEPREAPAPRIRISPPDRPKILAPLGPRASVDAKDSAIAEAALGGSVPRAAARVITASVKDGRAVSPISLARSFVGADEQKHAREISAFIQRMTGQKIDPRETPWCAAFVNAVLKGSGVDGTGKLNARSFLDFGEATDRPSTGDVAVFWRESPDSWKGHVGFYAGEVEKNGQTFVRVIGGNQGNKVSENLYPKSQLLAYRRPPKVRAS